ncbi:hypothetical protein [Varunaivibrio sulfuroxidans]|uniref:4Fe-4S ferredoxin-type domain-containing protein n=1 Tax=Varunaivibrio sulfuroxidans TaxID=1773489 RepID=A0A4R3JD64_9PROT|nr:hypothetical protein [Varunaivibrio sulfuroxidans]TCS63627.1 hypothetical protein EDD55_103250 [Varunaivibrio sulfuroxidans]WES30232.1 ferredoxin [Varunaivibrio sulfuroxidans]
MTPPPPPSDITAIDRALVPSGLRVMGAFHPTAANAPSSLTTVRTIVLIGNGGAAFWPIFTARRREEDDALDRWTRRVITPLAAAFNAEAFFPFDGPPYFPFQRWAVTANCAAPSPIGTLIHPRFGPWHAYRGALGFAQRLTISPPSAPLTTCRDCAAKPCLSACPVNAFAAEAYDDDACARHLKTDDGHDCLNEGCRARRACPVGKEHRYASAQAAFHMRAFLRTRREDAD